MEIARSAGVLLHATSLPSGRLDADAYRFVDWLADAGVAWWQLLPVGPPDELGSPYSARSAFAGWGGLLAEPDAPVAAQELAEFREREAFWIEGWLRHAGDEELAAQVRFDREWRALRAYAAERGVGLVGDLPIYVSRDSADHREHAELFDEDFVSGTEPNRRHPDGQLWGHPLYDWDALAATGFRWWIERFRRTFGLFDLTRVDHFRGLASYWAIPADDQDPHRGHWRRGPRMRLFDAVQAELGRLPLFVEDPGDLTPDVVELREQLGAPGIGVLVRGFDERLQSQHRPENVRERQVVYTATHDNDTVAGWYASLSPEERSRVPVDPNEPSWGLIELALASPARLAIVPVQDVLGLGSEARMNVPGTAGGRNWRWKLAPGQLTAAHARELRVLVERHRRAAGRATAAA